MPNVSDPKRIRAAKMLQKKVIALDAARAARRAVTSPIPLTTPKYVPAETEFFQTYLYPAERVDDPAMWNNELAYYQLGQTDTPASPQSTTERWIETVSKLGTAVLNLKQQQEFSKLNMELARQGKPPVSAGEYASAQLPAARAEVGLDLNTRRMLMWGLGGLAAVAVMGMLMRQRA